MMLLGVEQNFRPSLSKFFWSSFNLCVDKFITFGLILISFYLKKAFCLYFLFVFACECFFFFSGIVCVVSRPFLLCARVVIWRILPCVRILCVIVYKGIIFIMFLMRKEFFFFFFFTKDVACSWMSCPICMYQAFRSVNFSFIWSCLYVEITSSLAVLCFWFFVCSFMFLYLLFSYLFVSFSFSLYLFWGRFLAMWLFWFRIFLDFSSSFYYGTRLKKMTIFRQSYKKRKWPNHHIYLPQTNRHPTIPPLQKPEPKNCIKSIHYTLARIIHTIIMDKNLKKRALKNYKHFYTIVDT